MIFQRFLSPPTIIATPSHQVAERPQDSIAYWLEEQSESSFKICFREKEIFAGLHQNIKMVSGLRICPIIAINLQLSIETGQDCNGTGGFILAQESNGHNKKKIELQNFTTGIMLDQIIASVSRSERLNFRQARTACKVLRQLKEIRSDFSGKEIETGKKNENQQKRLPIGCRIELQMHDHIQMIVPL